MDPLSDILALLKPMDYGFRGLDAAGDWALSFQAAEGVRCFAIETGSCSLQIGSDGPATVLGSGNVVLLKGVNALRLFSSSRAETVDAFDLLSRVPAGQVVTLNGGGDCRGMGGFFGFRGPQAGSLLAVIPPVVHVRSDAGKAALVSGVRRLMRELEEPLPGSALLVTHLAQALLVEALRAHLDERPLHGSWLAALADPAMRRVLVAMHDDVARRWTLRDLAHQAGMSRSSFAARFRRVSGAPPMDYLTRWRMTLAADRLTDASRSLAEIAASVGYKSESAFGATFKRITGRSPRDLPLFGLPRTAR